MSNVVYVTNVFIRFQEDQRSTLDCEWYALAVDQENAVTMPLPDLEGYWLEGASSIPLTPNVVITEADVQDTVTADVLAFYGDETLEVVFL